MLSYAWIYNGLDDGATDNAFQWTIGGRQKTVAEHLDSFSGTRLLVMPSEATSVFQGLAWAFSSLLAMFTRAASL